MVEVKKKGDEVKEEMGRGLGERNALMPIHYQHSSSVSRRFGMPFWTMNFLPVSGQTRAPSSKVT
jgi:hypothetical protein